MYVCTICAFFRLCNYPCQIMRLSIAHISHNAKSWPIMAHILQVQILRWCINMEKNEAWLDHRSAITMNFFFVNRDLASSPTKPTCCTDTEVNMLVSSDADRC